jgi:hypothetical protein
MWKYHTYWITDPDPQSKLNEFGALQWELVSIHLGNEGYFCVFKMFIEASAP